MSKKSKKQINKLGKNEKMKEALRRASMDKAAVEKPIVKEAVVEEIVDPSRNIVIEPYPGEFVSPKYVDELDSDKETHDVVYPAKKPNLQSTADGSKDKSAIEIYQDLIKKEEAKDSESSKQGNKESLGKRILEYLKSYFLMKDCSDEDALDICVNTVKIFGLLVGILWIIMGSSMLLINEDYSEAFEDLMPVTEDGTYIEDSAQNGR